MALQLREIMESHKKVVIQMPDFKGIKSFVKDKLARQVFTV